jgi:hypothetical protein
MSLAEPAATADSTLLVVPMPGPGAVCHDLPFQRKTRVVGPLPVLKSPTASALLPLLTVTPLREFWPPAPPALGLATFAHVWPFQCRVSGLEGPLAPKKPTAHALLAELAPTAVSVALVLAVGDAAAAHV